MSKAMNENTLASGYSRSFSMICAVVTGHTERQRLIRQWNESRIFIETALRDIENCRIALAAPDLVSAAWLAHCAEILPVHLDVYREALRVRWQCERQMDASGMIYELDPSDWRRAEGGERA